MIETVKVARAVDAARTSAVRRVGSWPWPVRTTASRLEDWFNLGVQTDPAPSRLAGTDHPARRLRHPADFVRVLARVVLSRDPRNQPRYDEDQVVRGWQVFVTAPAIGVPVAVYGGRRELSRRSPTAAASSTSPCRWSLPPGWHEISLGVHGDAAGPGQGARDRPGATFGLVSDIDDTVMLTMLPRPLIAAWNTFVRDEQARRVVPGMAEMYARTARRPSRRADLLPVHRRLEHRAHADPVPGPARVPGRSDAADRLGTDEHRLVPQRPRAQAHRAGAGWPRSSRSVQLGADRRRRPARPPAVRRLRADASRPRPRPSASAN